MTFDLALQHLRDRYHLRRADWKATIGWSPGADHIRMFWPSSVSEVWRPTLGDVEAADWMLATGESK